MVIVVGLLWISVGWVGDDSLLGFILIVLVEVWLIFGGGVLLFWSGLG